PPRESMSQLCLPVDTNMTVTILVFSAGPDKTVALPLSPKCKRLFWCFSYHKSNKFRVTMFPPPLIMLTTPTARKVLLVAPTYRTFSSMFIHFVIKVRADFLLLCSAWCLPVLCVAVPGISISILPYELTCCQTDGQILSNTK